MRMRIEYYVCTGYEVTFTCLVQSTSDYLHLVWTIALPGHKNRTIILDRNNQTVQMADLSLNSSVTSYDMNDRIISSSLFFHLPSVHPRYSSRAYVICGVPGVSNKSVPLRYYPGIEACKNTPDIS